MVVYFVSLLIGDRGRMNKNYFLYFLKAIAAYSIIFIHCKFYGEAGMIIDSLARFAVPIFFLSSGYFVFTKEDALSKKIYKRIKNLTCVFLFCSIVYFMLKTILSRSLNITAIDVLKLLIFNDTSFISAHLWFLPALIYCYILLLVAHKLKMIRFTFILIPVLLVVNIIVGFYFSSNHITEQNNYIIRNFLFFGFPFFMIGYFINTYKDKVSQLTVHIKPHIFALGIIIGNVITVIDYKYIGDKSLYFGSVIVSVLLFIYSLKKSDAFNKSIVSKIGEKYSLFIYLWHPIVISGVSIISNRINISHSIEFLYVQPIIIVLLVTTLSIIYYTVKEIVLSKKLLIKDN